ncbi:MAG: PEPxxWA-CTERM sorting domain-containing protein [Sandaracinobacter sp.]
MPWLIFERITGGTAVGNFDTCSKSGDAGGDARAATVTFNYELPRDVYSNGTNYPITFSKMGYLHKLSTSDNRPLTYFGHYLPALDGGDQLEFLKYGTVLATITPANVIAKTGACPNALNPYCGNPRGAFAGAVKHEQFAFINVCFFRWRQLHAICIFENFDQGGYESDNHTVGCFLNKDGVVSEPATWAMLNAGFGLVGLAARLRQTPAAAASA